MLDDLGITHDWLMDNGHESFTNNDQEFQAMGHPFEIGAKYMVETVTKYYTGELAEIHFDWIVLVNAAWIPQTGRFNLLFRSGGVPEEVEPYPDNYRLRISIGSIVNVGDYPNELPRSVR